MVHIDEPDAPAVRPCGRVLGTEDATPLEFWVARAPGRVPPARRRRGPRARSCRTGEHRAHLRRRRPGAGPPRGRPLRHRRVPHRRRRAARPRSARRRTCRPRASSRRCSCRRCPGDRGAAGRSAPSATRRSFFDEDGAPAARRPVARRRAACSSTSTSSTAPRAPTSTSRGISGVATKTTYATFLLYSLFHSGVLGAEAVNTKALIFNVKGEDLLFLDHPNTALDDRAGRALRARSACPPAPFRERRRAAPRRGAGDADGRAGRRPAARRRHAASSGRIARVLPSRGCCRSCSPTPRTSASSTRSSSTPSPPELQRAARARRPGDGAVAHRRHGRARRSDELVDVIERS